MAKNKDKRFHGFDNGRVVDQKKKTVYSAKQVNEMHEESLKSQKTSNVKKD